MVTFTISLIITLGVLLGGLELDPHLSALIVNLAYALLILYSVYTYLKPKVIKILKNKYQIHTVLGNEDGAAMPKVGQGLKGAITAVIDKKHSKNTKLLQQLAMQGLPNPRNDSEESILSLMVERKGVELKVIFCQEIISYLQGLVMILSDLSDNSSSKRSSNNQSSIAVSEFGNSGVANSTKCIGGVVVDIPTDEGEEGNQDS